MQSASPIIYTGSSQPKSHHESRSYESAAPYTSSIEKSNASKVTKFDTANGLTNSVTKRVKDLERNKSNQRDANGYLLQGNPYMYHETKSWISDARGNDKNAGNTRK